MEDRAGPSGYQKKARSISSTEFLKVSSVGAEVVEMSGVSDSYTSIEEEVGERIEVGSSSSQRVDMVVTSGEVAAIGGVATSSQEVVLDSEQEGDVEEDGEISEDMEEVDEKDQEEAVGEGNSEEEIEVNQPEGMVEDNSSGTRQVGRGVAGSSLPGPGQGTLTRTRVSQTVWCPPHSSYPFQGGMMGFQKLSARHRFVLHCVCLIRIENFARQVLSSDRFVFGSGQASSGLDVIVTSSNSGLPGQEGLDRIAKDIQQFVKGGGAAVQQEAAEGDGVPLRTVRRTG